MSDVTHLNDRQLLRAIGGEMTPVEHVELEAHLARCETCLERWDALAEFWSEVEKTICATPVEAPRGAREQLVEALAGERGDTSVNPGRRWRGWYWAAAMAASAAVLFFALSGSKQATPHQDVARQRVQADPTPAASSVPDRPALPAQDSQRQARPKTARNSGSRQKAAGNAETSAFIRLPYADATQPMQTAGLVRVQMKLSMLANAGVIQMMPGASDGPVQADVLLGFDGQPYAIRLVSASQ